MGLDFVTLTGMINACHMSPDCECGGVANVSGNSLSAIVAGNGYNFDAMASLPLSCRRYKSITIIDPDDCTGQGGRGSATYDVKTNTFKLDDDCLPGIDLVGDVISASETRISYEGTSAPDKNDSISLAGLIADSEYESATREKLKEAISQPEFGNGVYAMFEKDAGAALNSYFMQSVDYFIDISLPISSGTTRTARADWLEITIPYKVEKDDRECNRSTVDFDGVSSSPKSATINFGPNDTRKLSSKFNIDVPSSPSQIVLGYEAGPIFNVSGSTAGQILFRKGFQELSGEWNKPVTMYKKQELRGSEENAFWLFKKADGDEAIDPTEVEENTITKPELRPFYYNSLGGIYNNFPSPYDAIFTDTGRFFEETEEWDYSPQFFDLKKFGWSGMDNQKLTIELSEEYTVSEWVSVLQRAYGKEFFEGIAQYDYFSIADANNYFGGRKRVELAISVNRTTVVPHNLDEEISYDGRVVYFVFNPFDPMAVKKEVLKHPFTVTIPSGQGSAPSNKLTLTPTNGWYYQYSGVEVDRKPWEHRLGVRYTMIKGQNIPTIPD